MKIQDGIKKVILCEGLSCV